MLMLITKLTQERMSSQLMYITELECTVLEVKVVEGLGTTLDVILINGVLHEGDRIVICGLNGPIVTQVRALLTPQPLKELRVRVSYPIPKNCSLMLIASCNYLGTICSPLDDQGCNGYQDCCT